MPDFPSRSNAPRYPQHRAVSAAESALADRRAQEEFGLPSVVLMEHAARGLAGLVAGELSSRKSPHLAVVVCGPGNNGGDGYGCARFLASWGCPVRVVRAAPTPPTSRDARIEHDLVAREMEIVAAPMDDEPAIRRALADASVIVDALFGVGLSRPLSSPYPPLIELVNACDARRIAVDVPSGIDADTGLAMPVAVRAHVTAAMGMPKRGCLTRAGATYAGEIVEIDIGLPAAIHRAFVR